MMENYTIDMIRYWLKDTIRYYKKGTRHENYENGICLLDLSDSQPLSNCICITDAYTLQQAITAGQLPDASSLLLIADAEERLNITHLSIASSLLITTFSFHKLFNRLQQAIHQFHQWQAQMEHSVLSNCSLQTILDTASYQIPGTFILLNTGYKQMAAHYSTAIDHRMINDIRENGYLSDKYIQEIQTAVPGFHNQDVNFHFPKSQTTCMIRQITFQNNIIARLFIIFEERDARFYVSDLASILSQAISQHMYQSRGNDFIHNTEMSAFLTDLIECRLTDPIEIAERKKKLHLYAKNYYQIMLIDFNTQDSERNVPWNYVIDQIEPLFPFSNITIYQNQILILLKKEEKSNGINFFTPAFEAILKANDACAALSNPSDHLTSMPPIYYQTRAALRIGKKMHSQDGDRFYRYEDYGMYHIIEMAATASLQNIGNRNPLYLCCPEFVSLLFYDKDNDQNLTDIMFAYLTHERSVIDTADYLFLHRNTLHNKIRKVEEIIGQKLNDQTLRERLIFSYHVWEYARSYAEEDILTLKRSEPVNVGQ